MLAPGLVVWNQFISVPADATEIEVVGQQWQWSFRLPGKDGRLGKADTRLVSAENPLGLIATDANGNDDVVIEGGDLHLPLGKPVKLLLRSDDVMHDFYVPQIRAKMDMVPGLVTYFWFTPTSPANSEFFALSCAAWGTPTCAEQSSSTMMATIKSGCRSSVHLPSLLLP